MEIDSEKYCGGIGTSSEIPTPFSIITNTNTVDLRFITSRYGPSSTRTGFLAIWSPYDIPTGCNNCDFPFTFGDATFDTCISVLDVDTQSWCSYNNIPPEVPPPVKIYCSDSDSSCPSSPPRTVITSTNYPLNYPNNANEVK